MGSRTGAQQANEGRDYMSEKKHKLNEQFDEAVVGIEKSQIFKGISIYVNGYTNPSSDILRRVIHQHGGQYHTYYSRTRTSHIVATNLPHNKIHKLRPTDKVVSPQWIIHSIREQKLLDDDLYLVYRPSDRAKTDQNIEKFTVNSGESTTSPNKNNNREMLKTTDPNFVTEFYARSRLHYISVWAQELKTLVNQLKQQHNGVFEGHCRIKTRNTEFEENRRVIMHIDMDCFFVSVGLLSRVDLIGKPVAVTHSTANDPSNSRAEIASCSYEARAMGVKSGTYFGSAMKLCPTLVSIPYEFDAYKIASRKLYEIVCSYTLDLEAVSCDELYVDLTNVCCKLKADPMLVCQVIREQIQQETGCIASAGLGPNFLVARLATKKAKPNGQVRIVEEDVREFMNEHAIIDLPGVGWRTEQKLNQLGIETCPQLANFPLAQLAAKVGDKTAKNLQKMAIGDDSRCINSDVLRKSVSVDINYGVRMQQMSELLEFVANLSKEVTRRLTECKMLTKSVTLKLLVGLQLNRLQPGRGSKPESSGIASFFAGGRSPKKARKQYESTRNKANNSPVRQLACSPEKRSTKCDELSLSMIGESDQPEVRVVVLSDEDEVVHPKRSRSPSKSVPYEDLKVRARRIIGKRLDDGIRDEWEQFCTCVEYSLRCQNPETGRGILNVVHRYVSLYGCAEWKPLFEWFKCRVVHAFREAFGYSLARNFVPSHSPKFN